MRLNLPDPCDGVARASAPVPQDVKKAIRFLRDGIGRRISVVDLVKHCGVAERTLNKHFCLFIGFPPLRYWRRLRLAAVREALLSDPSSTSVTEAAKRYGFLHFGRFSAQYRRRFGESPSTTLRHARAALPSKQHAMRDRADTEPSAVNVYGPGQALPSRDKPAIAILAIRPSSPEPVHHDFIESVAEGVTAALCPLRSLSVTLPRSSRVAIRDPQRSARELGARYFLTVRMTHTGSRLRIIVLLADSTTGYNVWGDSYDGGQDHLLELQRRVIGGVVRAILPSIRGAEIERARRTNPEDLDVYGLVMRALPFVFASRPDGTRRALELLKRALEIDPDYGLATALAAWCHGQLVMYNGSKAPAEDKARAVWLAQRAAILDSDDPLVLTARCAVHTMTKEFHVADALLARALALDPTSSWAWGRSGWLNSYLGNSDTAIEHFRRSISLDPYSPSNANSLVGIGSAHFDASRYRASAFWMRKALLEQPGTLWANRTLSVSYARLGERTKALESLEALRRYCPDLTVGQVVAAIPFRPRYLDRLGDGLNELGLPL
jgi:adenylate cyclase